jgi:hypothetical protein
MRPHTIPHPGTVKDIHRRVRTGRLDPQVVLTHEYQAPRPRWALITWLKRHGARPATTRVIRSSR